MRGARAAALLLAAAAALPAGACGRKGPPVPPEIRMPQPVGDLRGVVRAGAIELTWTNPRRRADNSRLAGLSLARLYRVEDDGRGDPKPALLDGDRVMGWTEVAIIRLDTGPSAFVRGDAVTFPDRRGLVLGRRYTYVVVAADPQGRVSPPGSRVSVTFLPAPEPPTDLTAEPGDAEVRLAWRAPARLVDGAAVATPLAYEVLRGDAPDGPLAAVTRTQPGETRLVDRQLENDRAYYYAVRAIRLEGPAEGEPSPRVAATPVDTTPPSPPGSLVAIPSEGAVRLVWLASPETDVAGYVVYRAEPGRPFVRVGSTRVPQTTFTDRDVPSGTWRYVVTAQDQSARANESRRSNEVSVTVP